MFRFATSMGLVVVSLFGVVGTASAADYSVKGSLTTKTTTLPSGQGGSSGGNLVVPDAAGTYPLLVASHGFSASAANQVGWAEHFASYGFVVVVPSFGGGLAPDHQKNAGVIAALAKLYSDPTTASPAKGKVDASKVGLEGHSAGGLATALAAANIKPGAVVLFDPVDANDLGKKSFGSVCSPVIEIFSPPSSCNASGNWVAFKDAATGPNVSLRVQKSTHCDGENAARWLCGLTCGGAANTTRQGNYAHYGTAQFLAYLKGDKTAAAELTLSALTAHPGIEAQSVRSGTACSNVAPLLDDVDTNLAPTPANGEAPTASVGNPGTSDGTVNADPSLDPAAKTAEATGGGCSAAPMRNASFGVTGLLGLLGLAFVTRRRRS